MDRDEFVFANDLKVALEERAPRTAWILTAAIGVLILAGGVWASVAILDEVTTGPGKVVPSQQLQIVQPLEPGIIRDILVEEGQLVEAGEILMHVDDTAFSSELGELHQRRGAFQAQVMRLRAEANGADAMPDKSSLPEIAAQSYEVENQLFRARRKRVDDEVAVLEQQLIQKVQEVREFEARREKLLASLKPLERELDLTTKLYERQVVPEVELLRLQREAIDLRGERNIVLAALPRAQAAYDEVLLKIKTARASLQADAREQLAKVAADLSVIEQKIRSAKDRVVRTALRSPTRGVINALNVRTVGAVVISGQALVEIVPLDDTLLIEARIRPQDVAFIRPDQEASVKLTAYDFSIYGTLDGRVERISADTTVDDQGEAFYRIMVRTNENALLFNGNSLPILPGMIATVDVRTGTKTVLDYILKPIRKARYEALRER